MDQALTLENDFRLLDLVGSSGIGIHPGISLVLHADLRGPGFEGSEKGKLVIVGSGSDTVRICEP